MNIASQSPPPVGLSANLPKIYLSIYEYTVQSKFRFRSQTSDKQRREVGSEDDKQRNEV